MPSQDTSEIKKRIVSVISQKGPLLPVVIARETGLNTLFASAFLSELLNDKVIKMSNMKVGSSSVYFIPGQEPKLEDFSKFLKSKEKDAFNLLKGRKVLKDSEQEPAIRVALRQIKDFAIPFKNGNEIYWRFFMMPNEEIANILKTKDVQTKIIEKPLKKTEKELVKKKPLKKKSPQSEKFLEKIKGFLLNARIEILSIESMAKDELVLRVKENSEESLLIAFNKKRLTDREIVKAAKKASVLGLRYSVVSFGKMPKKTLELMEALKSIKKVDEVK